MKGQHDSAWSRWGRDAESSGDVGDRSRFVQAGFAETAPWYDWLTRLFSFGMDGRWRRNCLDACGLKPGETLLDVATGTGPLAIEAARRVQPGGRVVGLDFCAQMLREARRKAGKCEEQIAWIAGKAESLPLRSDRFDCLTVGFAMRHVSDLAGTLEEMGRVLHPGGRLAILEFTQPEGFFARALLRVYLGGLVPPLVGLLSRRWRIIQLARYLPASIERFVSAEGLCRSIESAGLAPVMVRQCLAGTVTICVAIKPPDGRDGE